MAGWTQTPNFIYDLLPEMNEAEIKVVMVIVRQTIGWKRETFSATVNELMALTHMARASVVAGIRAAMEHGILSREPDGKSYIYEIIEPICDSPSVQILNRQPAESVQNLDPEQPETVQNLNSKELASVQNLDRQSVQNLNPIKRNINTNKQPEGKKEIAADAAPPDAPSVEPVKPKRTRTPRKPPHSEAPPQRAE